MTTRRVLRGPPPTPIKRLGGLDYELQQVQNASERATRKARADKHVRAVRVRAVATAAGDYTYSHRLGYKPEHFSPVDVRGGMFYVVKHANSRTFTINVSGGGTIDFQVW